MLGEEERLRMKKIIIYCTLLIAVCTIAATADFLEPLTDTPVGKTATGKGWLVFAEGGQPTAKYAVIVFTDTGMRWVSATLAKGVDAESLLGRPANITAVVQADKPQRVLEITKIELRAR